MSYKNASLSAFATSKTSLKFAQNVARAHFLFISSRAHGVSTTPVEHAVNIHDAWEACSERPVCVESTCVSFPWMASVRCEFWWMAFSPPSLRMLAAFYGLLSLLLL